MDYEAHLLTEDEDRHPTEDGARPLTEEGALLIIVGEVPQATGVEEGAGEDALEGCIEGEGTLYADLCSPNLFNLTINSE